MARPRKKKSVCSMPSIEIFGPLANAGGRDGYIELTVEEFETIRLIDYENLTQQECGDLMQVGRSTVQRLYEIARGKIADSIVNGRTLKIGGGDYKLCDQLEEGGACRRCQRRRRHRHGRRFNE